MENEKKAVGLLKYLLSFIVLLSIILCPKRVVYADDVTYSTTGGTWKQVNDTGKRRKRMEVHIYRGR